MKLLDIIDSGDQLGECPLWNAATASLWWTDVEGRRLRRWRPGGGAPESIAVPEPLGSFAFLRAAPAGEMLLGAFETGLALFRPGSGAAPRFLARPEYPAAGRRFNDGRTDRQGRFRAGTMVEDRARAGASSAGVWRVDADGTVSRRWDGVRIGNGLACDLAGTRLYFADSLTRRIDMFDLDPATGTETNRRVFAAIDGGVPDGAVVDAEDCLWSAIWGPGEIRRFAPDGREIARFALPAAQVSCPAFGGAEYGTLFVTSARIGTNPATDPQAGSLFVVDAGVRGVAPDLAAVTPA